MRLLKTKNRRSRPELAEGSKLQARLRAFTLMEVLIAASIFAVVMILATTILGQSSTFREKIRATREASDEAKKAADMITRDVKESAYPAKINLSGNIKNFKKGIAVIKITGSYDLCSAGSCSFSFYCNDDFGHQTTGNLGPMVLVTTTHDNYIVHVMSNVMSNGNKELYYKTYPRLDASGNLITLTNTNITNASSGKINSSGTEFYGYLDGFAPDDASVSIKQQPFVMFDIISQTKNYDNLPANARAKMEIKSSVTARSFAN